MQALVEAIVILDKQTPTKKHRTMLISIDGVNPLGLIDFMKKKNIPDDAQFMGQPNAYDAFDDICLGWDIDVPTTDTDNLKYKQDNFPRIAYRFISASLTANGYKKCGFDSSILRKFKNHTIYDLYINNEQDLLLEYYSAQFKLTQI